MIDLLTCLAPASFVVGTDPATGEPASLEIEHLLRGLNVVGQVGSGKTDTTLELLRANAFSGRGWVYLDMAGTGFAQAARFDALTSTLLRLGVETPYAAILPEVADLATRFSRRHAYVSVGEEDPPVRVNLLRRLRRKDGRRETPDRVAGRFVDIWAATYADISIRVLFMKWGTVVAGLLSAADRAISEYALLFESESYRAFLQREQERLGTAADPYVREQWEILRSQFLQLRKQPGDGASARQLQEIGSLHNSLSPLRAGPMAAFFAGNENVALEDVVYGGARLYVSTNRLANVEHRKFILRSIFAAADSLITEIAQDDPNPISFLIFDEVGQITPAHLASFATLRNHRFSPILLRQTHAAQFEEMGMRSAAAIVEQCMQYGMFWRPETEALARAVAVRGPIPDFESVILTLVTESWGWSENDAASAATTWVESFGEDATGARGGSAGRSEGTTTSGGMAEQKVRIAMDEIFLRRTVETLQLPEYHAVHVYKGVSRTIRHRRARQLPRQLFGRDYLTAYLAANRILHDRTAERYVRYDPTIQLTTADAPAAHAHPGPEAAQAQTAPPTAPARGAAQPYQPGRPLRQGSRTP